MNKKLDKIFEKSSKLIIDDNTKLVIMSDCHRGAGDNYDNFKKNKNIFKSALQYYYIRGFTYIELGDGDEMWEVKDYKNIINIHIDIFKLIEKFHRSNRLIMIYGNHDIVKREINILEKYFYMYYNKKTKKTEKLLENIVVRESLILNYKNYDIFLLHGHQVDFLNGTIWRIARLLVRYIWKPLENTMIKDITGIAKNYQVTKNTEKKLKKWSDKNKKILIAGHTHRASFPKTGQSLYFNDGSCIHPNGITCLEIENGKITLVKWEFDTSRNKVISVKRKILEGGEPITTFLNKID